MRVRSNKNKSAVTIKNGASSALSPGDGGDDEG